jgi:hypothetical protein
MRGLISRPSVCQVLRFVPGVCAGVALLGFLLNAGVAMVGPLSVPAAPFQSALFYAYLSVWGIAPFLLGLAVVSYVACRRTGAPKRWIAYCAVCLAFWLCPPVFVL